jgi:hypothetical protein
VSQVTQRTDIRTRFRTRYRPVYQAHVACDQGAPGREGRREACDRGARRRAARVVVKRVYWFVVAAALALPTAAAAQLQLNQNFVTQGPAPSFGLADIIQSRDAPPHGHVAGAVGPVVADPLDANTLFIGTPGGGIWKTTDGGTKWRALTDKQASLSISSLAYDPTDANTLIAGTGLTSNGTVFGLAASGGLRNGLLYTQDGGKTWTSLGAEKLAGQSVAGVAARGKVLVAGTYEISGFASAAERNIGALYRSTDGGTNFRKISVRFWHIASFRCGAKVQTLLEVKRACRDRRRRINPT